MTPDIAAVKTYLMGLQDSICAGLEAADGGAFEAAVLEKERGGVARPRVLSDGAVLERAAVNFSHARGDSLPPAATARRPEMAGRGFEAASTSLIIHPRNPYAPTAHANFRCFVAAAEGAEPIWWFGGGFDLTPYYGFTEDVAHWHREAKAACDPYGAEVYPKYKAWCDEYFFLKHRGEARGVGGLFFDDVNEGGFERCFDLVRSIGDRFLPTYLTILNRRKDRSYGERERQWQLYRRGRYVEFNLIYDRGTLYGLQSGGRVESILASMPPLVRWDYDYQPEPGSPEAALYTDFLPARDWLGAEA